MRLLILSPGLFAVDFIPFLRHIPEWFPGGGFHKIAREWRHTLFDMTEKSFEFVLEQMMRPDASSLYSGGADTPVSAMTFVLLAMTAYPGVQRKCQAELDAVVDNDRLSAFADRDPLPRLSTMLQEVTQRRYSAHRTVSSRTTCTMPVFERTV